MLADIRIEQLMEALAEGKSVTYRPHWNPITGSLRATILLQEILCLWIERDCLPFYRFSSPCNDPMYQQGESWQEELGMTRREFETARGRIATRTNGTLDDNSLVSYWTTGDRLTWYAANIDRLGKELEAIGLELDVEFAPFRDYGYEGEYQMQPDTRAVRAEYAVLRPTLYAALVSRDGEYCRHCGTTEKLTIDHVVAVFRGGGNELSNLQLLCWSCNSRKGVR